jgi:hypothetical protein
MYIFRRPSVGEVIGTTQTKRRLSRKYHRHALDLVYQREQAERRLKRRAGYYSWPMKLLRAFMRGAK